MSVKFFLIRHGQTLWNEQGRYQGNYDTGLTGLGICQAKSAAKYLSRVKLSNIYSSPLKRAVDTANIIGKSKDLKVIVREGLKEIYFGKWEGMKFNDINNEFHDDYQRWLKDPYNNCPTGGESFKKVQERAVAEIDNMIGKNEDKSSIAVITHGGIILSLLVNWLQIPIPRWRSIIQRQGAINIVVINKGVPYVSAINYTGHFSPIYDDREDKVIEVYSGLKDKN
ncbi:MAG: histidine phosphatase family protein [Actinomycetota bacterium]